MQLTTNPLYGRHDLVKQAARNVATRKTRSDTLGHTPVADAIALEAGRRRHKVRAKRMPSSAARPSAARPSSAAPLDVVARASEDTWV